MREDEWKVDGNLLLCLQFSQFSSVAQSCPTLCDPHGQQNARPPNPPPTPEVYSKLTSIEFVMPSNHLILCCPLILPPSIFPRIRAFPMSWFFASSGKILEFQLQHQSFQWIFGVDFLQDWLVWSPCSPRDSQESSPAAHFESFSSSVLSLLHSPSLRTSQEATVRTGHGTMDWFQIGKEVHQGCILSPCLFSVCRVHHEKRWAGRSTSLDSIFKSRDITLPTKVHLVKAMVFPVVMYGWESWTVKKADRWRIDAFELWCWRRVLRVPWTARRSNPSILNETSPGCSLEGLMLKLKL